jgi:FKBP-type peptidyl-prolyl cis-trans isomerase
MKKLFVFICMGLSVAALHARPIQEDYKRAEEKARVSYALGMMIGYNLQQSTDLEFDYNAFADGLKAALEGAETQFSEQEALEILEAATQASMDKKTAYNRAVEEEFLTKNGERPEVQITPSGLQYEVLVETDGEKPGPDSVVRVRYEGSFTDGRPFDSSDTEEGVLIPLDRVIPGWTEGIMLMSAGSKYRLYIPSELAYGKEGIQMAIPPYSTLVFIVELIGILDSDEDEEEF